MVTRSKSVSAGLNSTGIRAIQPIVYLARLAFLGQSISLVEPVDRDIISGFSGDDLAAKGKSPKIYNPR